MNSIKVKHIKEKDYEIYVGLSSLDEKYTVTYINGNKSVHQKGLDLESALDASDYWLELHSGVQK